MNARAKIPIAKNKAGVAFAIVLPASAPISQPTNIGAIVAPIELMEPPNWSN